ncbi:MAG: site-specific integrase, partial [Bacteroidales bacterium]|nr:site-specific integrase [Bacteroidales bacterium]
MNRAKCKIILRKDVTRKDKTNSLVLRIRLNGKTRFYSLGHSILPTYWNERAQEVSLQAPDSITLNSNLTKVLTDSKTIIAQANLQSKIINSSAFDELFCNDSADKNDYFAFVEADLLQFGNQYAKETVKMYKSQSKKLKEFKSSLLFFPELTPFLWRQFDSYLINRGNNQNTRWKAFRTIKTFINKAIQEGIIADDPLKGVKVRKPEGNRQFLTQEELRALEKLYQGFLTPEYKRTLGYFLFSCYTGLRYTEIKCLKFKNVFIEAEKSYIQFVQHKTSQAEIIPLANKAKKLIPKDGFANQPVFYVYANQVT